MSNNNRTAQQKYMDAQQRQQDYIKAVNNRTPQQRRQDYQNSQPSTTCEICEHPSAAQGHPKGNNAASHFMHHPTAERPTLCEVCWIVAEQTYINRLGQTPPNGGKGKTRQQQIEALFDAAP